MKNMDKGLTVPKWVLIVLTKIPQMLQNLPAQAQSLDFIEKKPALGVRSQWSWALYEKKITLTTADKAHHTMSLLLTH